MKIDPDLQKWVQSVSMDQKVRFAIYCALTVNQNDFFHLWAKNWLNGSDRSESSARAAWKYEVATTAAVAAVSAAVANTAGDRAEELPLTSSQSMLQAKTAAAIVVTDLWVGIAAAFAKKNTCLVTLAEKAIKDS